MASTNFLPHEIGIDFRSRNALLFFDVLLGSFVILECSMIGEEESADFTRVSIVLFVTGAQLVLRENFVCPPLRVQCVGFLCSEVPIGISVAF